MIFDKIENHKNYRGLSVGIDKALDYLINTDLNSLSLGKHLIEDDEVFAVCMEYETKSKILSKNEGHKKYIDVQYIVSGEERMISTEKKELKITEKYDSERDVVFFQNGDECEMKVKAGYFAIFFPGDAHMPGLNIDKDSKKVKKVVVKVHV